MHAGGREFDPPRLHQEAGANDRSDQNEVINFILACFIGKLIKNMVEMCVHKHKASLRIFEMTEFIWSRRKAQTVDALAVRGEEGRGILRKA